MQNIKHNIEKAYVKIMLNLLIRLDKQLEVCYTERIDKMKKDKKT